MAHHPRDDTSVIAHQVDNGLFKNRRLDLSLAKYHSGKIERILTTVIHNVRSSKARHRCHEGTIASLNFPARPKDVGVRLRARERFILLIVY